MNPWLQHVNKFRSENPNMSYKDVLKNAKTTYKPVAKKQKGGGDKWGAIASLGNTAKDVIGNVSNTVVTQIDKNGVADSRIANRRRALFRQLKADMKKGNFPRTTDEKLLKYVQEQIPLK